jgi:TBC1 domain family member 2
VVDLEKLKKLSWNGVPEEWRAQVWQLLLAYLPSDGKRREQTVARKRREYADAVAQYFDLDDDEYRTIAEQKMLRQILVDVPRSSPDVPLFHQASVQRCLERMLYIRALRHPASGYVQGMDDLATPFFVVFLSAALKPLMNKTSKEMLAAVESIDAQKIPDNVLAEVEADTYWCLTKLLDSIQVSLCIFVK